MNSMHRNSPEEHLQDLTSSEAVSKITELCQHARMCFFCTTPGTSPSEGVRPMGFARVDDDGALWFISADDSNKNAEIAADPMVRLYVHGDHDAEFLYLKGEARITKDKAIIESLWSPFMKVWFTDGKDDPRLSAIEVRPQHGYYWDTKHGKAGFIIKSLASLVTGKTMDDGIEGKVSL